MAALHGAAAVAASTAANLARPMFLLATNLLIDCAHAYECTAALAWHYYKSFISPTDFVQNCGRFSYGRNKIMND